MIVVITRRIEGSRPAFDRAQYRIGVAFAQFLASLVTIPGFRASQLGYEGIQGRVNEFRLLDQWAILVHDSPNSAVVMITSRIAKVVLGVVDNRVVPVSHIHRAIWSDLAIHRTEVRMPRFDQRLQNIGTESSSVIDEFVTHDRSTFKAARQQLPLNRFRQMRPRYQVAPALFLC